MSKSYLKEALEADNTAIGIQDGLNHYVRRLQSIINSTPVLDGALIVAAMKILALAMEQKMDEDEKELIQHLINHCICFDASEMEETHEAD
jgi:hypothetical protein